jgi:hypothetical protein
MNGSGRVPRGRRPDPEHPTREGIHMFRREFLAGALAAWLAAGAFAADGMNVGSTRFPATNIITANGKGVSLVLTGAAMRQRYLFNVYAIASYVQPGTAISNAEELARADVVKQLHLVMQRDVAGRDVAESFRAAIRANYPEPQFNAEVDSLVQKLREGTARRGEQILLTHVPGVGLQVSISGKESFVIKNAGFSKAVWEIYLGANNISDAVKRGLVSRL